MRHTRIFNTWRSSLNEVTSASKRISDRFLFIEDYKISQTHREQFKIDVVTAIVCIQGHGSILINSRQYDYKQGDMLILLPEQIIQYTGNEADCAIRAIVFHKNFFDGLLPSETKSRLFTSIYMSPILSLDEDELKNINSYFTMILNILQQENHPYREKTIQYLTAAMFYGSFAVRHHKNIVTQNQSNTIYNRFMELLRNNYKKEHCVVFYANELCVSAKYLSKIIKETSGKLPSEWIDTFLVTEAQALLETTHLTISQISDELHYANSASFGKFFKKEIGVSPKDYRNNFIK